MPEKDVNNDPCDGDIEPDGVGPFGESLVGGPPFAGREKEGRQNHREHDD